MVYKKILTRDFYDRSTVVVARDLLGKILVRKIQGKTIRSIIAETEAYQADDPATHAFHGKTARNAILFGQVGYTYVHICHGIYYCFNIVARDSAVMPAGGVLIRAVIPIDGKDIIKLLHPNAHPWYIKGPGNVSKALGITRDQAGIDATSRTSGIYVLNAPSVPDSVIKITERIGISKGIEKPWRFYITNEFGKMMADQSLSAL